MILSLVLLAQAVSPVAPPVGATPPPSAPAPEPVSARDKMAASADKQREAAKRQIKSLGLHPGEEPTSFFTTPWPRPQPMTPPPGSGQAAPWVAPASYAQASSGGGARNWGCEPLAPAHLDQLVKSAAAREQVAPHLLRAVIRQESAGYPCAVSPQGAVGLMQLMPSTARQFSVRDAKDPKQNVDAGARLLKQLLERYPGDLPRALAAYNAGPAVVDHHGGVPPYAETQNYVQSILGWMTGQLSEQ